MLCVSYTATYVLICSYEYVFYLLRLFMLKQKAFILLFNKHLLKLCYYYFQLVPFKLTGHHFLLALILSLPPPLSLPLTHFSFLPTPLFPYHLSLSFSHTLNLSISNFVFLNLPFSISSLLPSLSLSLTLSLFLLISLSPSSLFPLGSSVISRGAGLGPVNIMNVPVTTSSPTSSSSSTSSSSVYPRTPSSSLVTIPTDHTSSPYPTSHVVTASGLPRLPVGTQEEPRSEYSTSSQWEESSIQATPSTTDVDTEVGPIPSLPVGFNSDGSRDNVDDVYGLSSMGSQNSLASQSLIDENILKSLQERVGALEKNKLMMEERNMSLEREVFNARKNFVHLQEQLKHIVIERDVLANERDKMSAIIQHLESQLSILRQSGGGREKTTPSGRLLSPNLHATTAQPRLENRRLTDPYFKDLNIPKHPPQHRPSDPNLRYISHHTATRPNNLPLGIAPGGTHYPPSISYQDTPLPLDVRVPPTSRMFRQLPGSD